MFTILPISASGSRRLHAPWSISTAWTGRCSATYGDGASTDYNVYFAGKQIWAERTPGSLYLSGPVALDRLGSVVSGTRHFPYGAEPSGAGQEDRVKFATYYRDQTTIFDYARNRYYSRTIGSFTTPDPYKASGGPADPQSWNRYAYVENDPVNFSDRSGLMRSDRDVCSGSFWGEGWGCGGGWFGVYWWDGDWWQYPDPDPISPWRQVTQAERRDEEKRINALLLGAWAAGASQEQAGQPYPKYLQVTADYYSCWGRVVQRNISYQLYGSDNEPMASGVITEHLFPVDYDMPVITKPAVNKSWGGPAVCSTTRSQSKWLDLLVITCSPLPSVVPRLGWWASRISRCMSWASVALTEYST